MTYHGKVNQGVVIFDGEKPPEGAVVEVLTADETRSGDQGEPATIWQELIELQGSAPDLPSDAAENHDHYLYGTPKR